MFDIPASKEEKRLVHESMGKLKNKLLECSELAKEMIAMLEENYLAIDQEYKKQLSRETETIMCVMWKLNIRLYKMQDQKTRIISPEIEESLTHQIG
jgi:hypothetical protein